MGGHAKRATDIVLATVALIGLSPVFLVIAVLIRVRMGGPVLYFHERVGYGGKTFRCYKFRSMVNNSDQVLARHLETDAAARQEWIECQKLRNDPRVSPLGKFLRASSLDELPQIFNILKGEMSCVGPRPVTIPELKRYGEAASEYFATRPGLTGLWQVEGRSTVSYPERVRFDSHYVRTWSWLGDLEIMARTIPALLRKGESY